MKNVLIEDRINQFHNKILFLIKNKNIRDKLGEEAKKLIKEKYDCKNIIKKFEQSIIN